MLLINIKRKFADGLMFLSRNGILKFVDDKRYIECIFYLKTSKHLNLKNPTTFNEKLQWLKLKEHNPQYTDLVDKYKVKKYISTVLGSQYVIPTLGVWNNAEEIDFDKLPEQFVLKVNHDSGGVVICKDKTKFDINKAKKKLNVCLKNNGYWYGREWQYKDVKPIILAEPYLSNANEPDLTDYKFYCFAGVPYYCQVIANRYTGETIDFFDMRWKLQEFTGLGVPSKPHSKQLIRKPIQFEKMKKAAEKLSKGFAFLRVDFYEVDGHMYFGELTLYPASGFGSFYPQYWNKYLGDLVILPR